MVQYLLAERVTYYFSATLLILEAIVDRDRGEEEHECCINITPLIGHRLGFTVILRGTCNGPTLLY